MSDGAMTRAISRRALLGAGLGTAAFAELLRGADRKAPYRTPKCKRAIWLFQSGGPSQLDLFDPKPELIRRNGEDLPDSVRRGQRLTAMSGNQARLPLAGSIFRFAQHGGSGAWVSELLPNLSRIVDRLCFVRSLHTEAINHDPAITFFQTGAQNAGRPSIGAWLDFGLGSTNRDLPAFVVLVTKDGGGQPIYARLWGAGFLPARHEGVQFRPAVGAVPYLADPPGIDRAARRRMLDAQRALHELELAREGDPAVEARIEQAELAFRMQASVPEVTDLADEPASTFALYGEDARVPGTYAANCLLARRLAERGVRFVQLFHRDWDHHGELPAGIRQQCRLTDRASAALVVDLARRGLLDETLVVWGGEFGRTCYSQGALTPTDYGRDHHPRCFTHWLAGGGVRAGYTHGETDELGYNVVRDPVHVHDLHATVLHLLGVDHERLTYRFQGRDYRLTDVHGRVVHELLA
jgi:hypothetical protein